MFRLLSDPFLFRLKPHFFVVPGACRWPLLDDPAPLLEQVNQQDMCKAQTAVTAANGGAHKVKGKTSFQLGSKIGFVRKKVNLFER